MGKKNRGNNKPSGVRNINIIDPRTPGKNPEYLLRQVNYAPASKGGVIRTWPMDLCPFEFSWSEPPTPPPTGIRLQIWNTPSIDADTGTLITVPVSDYLAAFAEGVRRKEDLSSTHLQHSEIKDIAEKGLGMVEYRHVFKVSFLPTELLNDGVVINHPIIKGFEKLWRTIFEDTRAGRPTCRVYDLTGRSHETKIQYGSSTEGEKLAGTLDLDGLFFRRLLRGESEAVLENTHTSEKMRPVIGKKHTDGTILLIFLNPDTREPETALILPGWIALCMRETYLKVLKVALPGLVSIFPTLDLWAEDSSSEEPTSASSLHTRQCMASTCIRRVFSF